jgi:hypothetical protein
MYSIRSKLNWALIFLLIVVSLIFSLPIIYLYVVGTVFTAEVYAQIFAALATLLVIFLTLGLKLIDDTLNRYERFAQPKLLKIQSMLEPCAEKVRFDLRLDRLYYLSSKHQEFSMITNNLKNYGQFFLTKLYPDKLSGIMSITTDLQQLNAMVNEIKPYFEIEEFHFESVLRFLFGDNIVPQYIEMAQRGKKKIESEKPMLLGRIRTLTENTLVKIEQSIGPIANFLEAN